MALKIRLRQQGRINRQTYRLVVTDIRHPRDGKYIENLGSYDPFKAENNLTFNADRLHYWIDKGAQLSENAAKVIGKASPEVIKGIVAKETTRRMKRVAERKKLKKG